MDFHPQRKGSFVSGSGRLCQISSTSVQNCDRESTDTQTDRQTDTHTEKTQVILLSVPCYAIAMGQIIIQFQSKKNILSFYARWHHCHIRWILYKNCMFIRSLMAFCRRVKIWLPVNQVDKLSLYLTHGNAPAYSRPRQHATVLAFIFHQVVIVFKV